MSTFLPGFWRIDSVIVDSETVMNYEGFERLQIANDQIRIEPIGLAFTIQESHHNTGTTLMSQGQVFNVQHRERSDQLELTMTRPKFAETIVIAATKTKPVLKTSCDQERERGVVQV